MNIKTILLTVTLLLTPVITLAQTDSDTDPETPKWYQVELFIFANNNPASANSENWKQDLGLQYPPNIIELGKLTDAAADQLEATAIEINLNDQSLSGSHSSAPAAINEQAFTELATDELQLKSMVRRIASRNNFRKLFHQAWRQPVANRENAKSVLIRAGDQYDSHFELEGYITLSLERYLHINTDLWLSAFVSNIGREMGPWPVLPKVPLNTDLNHDDFDQPPGPDGSHSSKAFDNPFDNIAGDLYAVDWTVALRQHRRMRSNELHYIDHPLMGLLIKVTPYEFPEQEKEQSGDISEPATDTAIAPSSP